MKDTIRQAREESDMKLVNNGLYDKAKSTTYTKVHTPDGTKVKFFRVRDFGAGGIKKDICALAKFNDKNKLAWTFQPDRETENELIKAGLIKKADFA